jgi:hypothetical protein
MNKFQKSEQFNFLDYGTVLRIKISVNIHLSFYAILYSTLYFNIIFQSNIFYEL